MSRRKKEKAVFTIVKDEKLFLPIWLQYYGKFFSSSDIYVLDHQSKDGSTKSLPCRVKKIEHEHAFDIRWMTNMVTTFQHTLLSRYEYVLFADADEFVIPDPLKYPFGLTQYINTHSPRCARCKGYEVIHFPTREPPYDPSKPILSQRKFWCHKRKYNKPLLASVPLRWELGFHDIKDRDIRCDVDEDLILVHLHKFDFLYCKKRNEEKCSYLWSNWDIAQRKGHQSRIVGKSFNQWWKKLINSPMEVIPKYFKGII